MGRAGARAVRPDDHRLPQPVAATLADRGLRDARRKRERTRPAARRRLPRDRRRGRARGSSGASRSGQRRADRVAVRSGLVRVRRAFSGVPRRSLRPRTPRGAGRSHRRPHSLHHVRCVQGGLRQEPGRVVEGVRGSVSHDRCGRRAELQFGQSGATEVAPYDRGAAAAHAAWFRCPHAAHRCQDGSVWFSASDAHHFPGLYRLPRRRVAASPRHLALRRHRPRRWDATSSSSTSSKSRAARG